MKPTLALIRGEDLKNENIDAFLNALGISDDEGKKQQPKDEPLRRRTGGKRSRRKDGEKRRPEGA